MPIPRWELESPASGLLWDPEQGSLPLWASASLSVQRQIQNACQGVESEQEVRPPVLRPSGSVFRKSQVSFISQNSQIRGLWGNKSVWSFGQGLMWGKKQEEALFCVSRGQDRKGTSPSRTGAAAGQTAPPPSHPGVPCVQAAEPSADHPTRWVGQRHYLPVGGRSNPTRGQDLAKVMEQKDIRIRTLQPDGHTCCGRKGPSPSP